ncbi:hypothetical protein [Halorubrum trueperi]|uniref:Uncharacterized protein n=1 Tax=Halorubrum trueperi TaxID=2004704 RepID=A0ABD5UGL0_9EURY
MSDETDDEEIHVASDDAPVLTKYEPDFRRVFARGTLLRMSESDDNTVQLGFWSDKDTEIEMDDGVEATGYQLETEVMMHWDGVLRLRNLLDNYIEEHAPDHLDE